MHAKEILTVLTLTATAAALAACADPTTSTGTQGTDSKDSTATNAAHTSYDVSAIPTVDEIAALVPEDIKKRGTLRNGASTGYAPAEYMDADGQTPIGYDIDINKALAKVMGLHEGETKHSEFPTIIPALGTKFDVGISSFTITSEREQQVNMVSYLNVGSAWGVAAGNPKNFDPSDPCGSTIAVQTGTAQEEYAATLSKECVEAGKSKITVMPHELQTDIATKLIGGQYDATLADSTVIGYASSQSTGKIEQLGDTFESAPQGVAIAKDDAQLTEATQKAMQYLMDNGYLKDILATYGADNAALATADLNPRVD
ncbi:MAG: ABC transporter substrate-binding protein [Schaalia odontolytica]